MQNLGVFATKENRQQVAGLQKSTTSGGDDEETKVAPLHCTDREAHRQLCAGSIQSFTNHAHGYRVLERCYKQRKYIDNPPLLRHLPTSWLLATKPPFLTHTQQTLRTCSIRQQLIRHPTPRPLLRSRSENRKGNQMKRTSRAAKDLPDRTLWIRTG